MPDQNTVEYYARRAERSREMARTAINPAISRVHAELAERYEELIRLTPAENTPTVTVTA